MDATWAEQNEDAIVDALATTLDVLTDQINIISISPMGDVRRRLEAGEKQLTGFKIHFTVDVVEEAIIPELTNVVKNFVRTDSGVHESFVNELHSELKTRNAPMPVGLSTLQPLAASSEVWLRGAAAYFQVPQPQYSSSWIVGPWGSCQGSCGISMQNRSVECTNEHEVFCAAAGKKPPGFRECKHPTPCPTSTTSNEWGMVVVVIIAVMLTCVCACCWSKIKLALGNLRQAKKVATKKPAANIPPVDIHAFVKAQTSHSAQPDVQQKNTEANTQSTEGDAPTFLSSCSREPVKSVALTISDPILTVADIETGSAASTSCETRPDEAATHDLDKWLTNCDMGLVSNLKVPDIPIKVDPVSADSAV